MGTNTTNVTLKKKIFIVNLLFVIINLCKFMLICNTMQYIDRLQSNTTPVGLSGYLKKDSMNLHGFHVVRMTCQRLCEPRHCKIIGLLSASNCQQSFIHTYLISFDRICKMLVRLHILHT